MPTPGSSVETTPRYAVHKVVSRRIETLAPPKRGAERTAAGLKRVWQRQILELAPDPVLFLEAIAFRMQVLSSDVYQTVAGDIKVLSDNGLGIHLQLLNGARTGEYVAMRHTDRPFSGQISFTVLNFVADSESAEPTPTEMPTRE